MKQLFKLGQVVATPGALAALDACNYPFQGLLARHVQGDWGDLDAFDRRQNDLALEDGSRLLSAYVLPTGVKLYIITEGTTDEGEREVTTILQADEY